MRSEKREKTTHATTFQLQLFGTSSKPRQGKDAGKLNRLARMF